MVGAVREPSFRHVACLWPVKMLMLINSGSIPGDACIVDNKPPKLSLGDDLPDYVDADAVQPPEHVFFDIEAKQVESRHVPNLLVCQRADDDVFHWWYGDACVQEFLL